jgi:hypothetical protein
MSSGASDLDRFVQSLLDRAVAARLPRLFAGGRVGLLRHVRDRHGVAVAVARTPALEDDELLHVLTYRLAQYVVAHQLDPQLLMETGMEHEPPTGVTPSDIHVIAGDAASGEILCYLTLKSGADHCGDATMGARDRWLFPVEQVFGAGVYRRLRLLPDLPVSRVVEMGRFAKNHQRDPLDPLMLRAPVEMGVAVLGLMQTSLRSELDAAVGDIEEGVAKKNLDYFHVPLVVLHGVIPYAAEGTFGFLNYQTRTRYPFAFCFSDLSASRIAAAESALERPGAEGLGALLALKAERSHARSAFEPPDGIPALADAPFAQQGVPMTRRRELLDVGASLRGSRLFGSLSVAEAAVLGTFMSSRTAGAGDVIIRQGEDGDDLFLIESGEAQVAVRDRGGRHTVVARLGPGECFGEIALVTGGERTADVIAATPMTLRCLTSEAYGRYLARLADVGAQVTRTALERTRETLGVVKARS